jgi:hypothetical protein
MSDNPLEPSPQPHKRSSLAKLAAILAALFIVGFGLCTANAMREGTAATVGAISGSIALICFVALIVVGLIAFFRSRT